MQNMIGRPGQTRPLVKEMEKEKEKEETIWTKRKYLGRGGQDEQKRKRRRISWRRKVMTDRQTCTHEQNLFL